jgi:DNA (cytosine-5)-methyltransferase 1
MKFLSVCSGIEAASVAWHPLGWESVAYSEIEPFPCKVLQHHYPTVPNLGDMTKFKEWPDADVNVFVGGTPCQSFSVAGLRKGLDDPRGNLMLTYLAIAQRYRPNWLVWENVPGVLSSAGGRDFGSFLGGLAVIGYGFAYRVLDAQYFGVAQRRRRVFVVGYLGDWRPAAAVLFERHSLQGHPAPSREKRQRPTASTSASTSVGSLYARTGQSISVQDAAQGHLMPIMHSEVCPALKARDHKGPSSDGDGDGAILVPMQAIATHDIAGTMLSRNTSGGFSNSIDHAAAGYMALQLIALAENTIGRKPENGGNGNGFADGGPMYTLNATGVHGVAQPVYELHSQDSRVQELGDVCTTVSAAYGSGGGNVPITLMQAMAVAQPMAFGVSEKPDVGHCLRSGASKADKHESTTYVAQAMAVRRLTPVECERLQGFPDNYTNIKPNGKPTPDGPRYKALGNSMAVPVMAWIGKRIQEVDAICKTQQKQ